MTTSVRVARRGERGAILPLFVLLLTAMLAFTGFGVDLGWWYSRSFQIQRAADAAALAAVVWMPDTVAAKTAAESSLKTNKFIAGGDISVIYEPIPPQRYRVTLKDAKVESYFTRVFMGDINVERKALAEYQLAVPLGSPYNHFGTPGDGIYGAVNGFCTSKEQGDQILSRFNLVTSGSPANRCPSNAPAPAGPGPNGAYVDNLEYSGQDGDTVGPFNAGYSYYVDLPAVRTQSVTIALYDAPFFTSDGNSPDNDYSNNNARVTTTFRLRAPDVSTLDDTDNALYKTPTYLGCGGSLANPRTFTTNQSSPFDMTIGSGTNAGRYTKFCTIPTTAPGGRYILDVYTKKSEGTLTNPSIGANAYGVFLQKGTSSSACDARTDATCPRVYGTDSISVYANQSSLIANFYLAQVSATYAGKQMVINLWDPGEGGSTIKIISPVDDQPETFSWFSDNGLSGTNVTSLDVTNSRFNGRKVTLTLLLDATYNQPASDNWWQIRYTFTSGTVTDRTTWSVNLLGDPVHLVG